VLDLFRGAYRKGEEGRISLLVQNHLRCPVGPTASRLASWVPQYASGDSLANRWRESHKVSRGGCRRQVRVLAPVSDETSP
jgi:hypothetical protein